VNRSRWIQRHDVPGATDPATGSLPRTAGWAVAGVAIAMAGLGALGGATALAGADPGSPLPRAPTQPPVAQFLDAAFGVAGQTDTEGFGGDRSAMALQSDGGIVMVGGTFTDFVMARYDAQGRLDATFGEAGFVTTDMLPDEQEEAMAVAIAPDGRIVVAGYSGFDATLAIARYAPDGSLDATFGDGGRVAGSVPGRGYAVAVQPDGAILVGGEAVRTDSATDFSDLLLARFQPDGTLDAGFGVDGVVVTDVNDGTNTLRNLVPLPDGTIVVSGEPFGDFEGSDHTDIARFGPAGQLDETFGTGGVLVLPGWLVGEGLAVQADGRLVLAGRSMDASGSTFAVMRLEGDGSPDATFGVGGLVTTDVGDQGDSANAVAIGPDGRIVAAGRSGDINADFAAVRYLPDGSLDPTFADAGTLTIDFHLFPDIAESVVIQPDGMTVLGGFVRQNVDGYGLARVLP